MSALFERLRCERAAWRASASEEREEDRSDSHHKRDDPDDPERTQGKGPRPLIERYSRGRTRHEILAARLCSMRVPLPGRPGFPRVRQEESRCCTQVNSVLLDDLDRERAVISRARAQPAPEMSLSAAPVICSCSASTFASCAARASVRETDELPRFLQIEGALR